MSLGPRRSELDTINLVIGVLLLLVGIGVVILQLRIGTAGPARLIPLGSIIAGVAAIVRTVRKRVRATTEPAPALADAEPNAVADDEPVRLARPLTLLEVARRVALVAGTLAMMLGATWFRFALFEDELSFASALIFVVGAALFLRAYAVTHPLPAPTKDRDLWDRCAEWVVDHAAIPSVVVLSIATSVMYAGVFQGETVGDDLTFHMAESARLADCLRAGDWDLWNPSANGGFASAYYYQVIPQLASALPAAVFGHHLFWFQLSLWLPLAFAPLAAYRGMRMLGASPWQAIAGAFGVAFLSGASRWGTGADGTFQVGLYTQTWALAAFPLGLGYAVRYLLHGDHLPAAIAWGAFVFLCHPFASIALCFFALPTGTLAYYLAAPIRSTTIKVVFLALVGVLFLGTAAAFALAPKYFLLPPLILFAAILVRLALRGRALTLVLLVGVVIALLLNLGAFVLDHDQVTVDNVATDKWVGWLYLGPVLLLGALAARLALRLRRSEPDELPRPTPAPTIRIFVRLCILGACLLVATMPGWLTVIVDRDGFGGFPHRVADEVGPGYKDLMKWFTSGAILDYRRFVVMTWVLPVVLVFARMRFARWLWAPALAYATLLAIGPHTPKTADDLLPAVRFLGAMQVVLALGIGAGAYTIARDIWHARPGSVVHRIATLFGGKRPERELLYGIRTAAIAIGMGLAIFIGFSGSRVLSSRINVLDAYDYRGEMMEMIDTIKTLPQGKKQVGPGCENHWWNLLSYVYAKRPSLLQMGGGGLQASPNYDFVWSVRDFPKLAWVYDTPLFTFARSNESSAPAGETLLQTNRYELRRLPAPGAVSAVEITGSLPEGESRAGSPVRKAAIDWLRSSAPMDNKHLAYHGHGGPSGPPHGKVTSAFHVDPSPGDVADIYATVEVEQPTTFVARESWHPRWHAYVDGAEVRVRRVTPDFPAIDVPAGKHVLAFRFERPTWANAIWLAWPGITIAAWAAATLLRRRRERATLPAARVVETR
ncbi:MAG TPA: hypothetical protein VFQ53_20375 [Kofleriaceae bacterium]|nr:hypothetical protein [Kofleriaceae bacterium]